MVLTFGLSGAGLSRDAGPGRLSDASSGSSQVSGIRMRAIYPTFIIICKRWDGGADLVWEPAMRSILFGMLALSALIVVSALGAPPGARRVVARVRDLFRRPR
jgi:hypothetical protein